MYIREQRSSLQCFKLQDIVKIIPDYYGCVLLARHHAEDLDNYALGLQHP